MMLMMHTYMWGLISTASPGGNSWGSINPDIQLGNPLKTRCTTGHCTFTQRSRLSNCINVANSALKPSQALAFRLTKICCTLKAAHTRALGQWKQSCCMSETHLLQKHDWCWTAATTEASHAPTAWCCSYMLVQTAQTETSHQQTKRNKIIRRGGGMIQK